MMNHVIGITDKDYEKPSILRRVRMFIKKIIKKVI